MNRLASRAVKPGVETLRALCDRARPNSFGFLRYLLSALVVYSHCFPTGGLGREPLVIWTLHQERLGTLAVKSFFVLSGFLVTHSYVQSGSALRYLWNRVLRIFPGFWVMLLAVAFGFAWLNYHHLTGRFGGFFAGFGGGSWDYVKQNWLLSIERQSINGLPINIPFPVTFNGSLWSLVYEFRCYLGLAILGLLGGLTRFGRIGTCIVFAVMAAYVVNRLLDPQALAGSRVFWRDQHMVDLAPWFCAGALLYLFSERIPSHWGLFAVALGITLATLHYGYFVIAGPLTLGYCLLHLALRLPLSSWDRKGDFSYGVYIYSFPIQQTLAGWNVQKYGVVLFFCAALTLATLLGALSWFAIEKPALSLKRLWPTEGLFVRLRRALNSL